MRHVVGTHKEGLPMKRTMAAKIMLASGTAALALGAAACEIEDAGLDGDMDNGVLEDTGDDM
jgi:hypothetical protein